MPYIIYALYIIHVTLYEIYKNVSYTYYLHITCYIYKNIYIINIYYFIIRHIK